MTTATSPSTPTASAAIVEARWLGRVDYRLAWRMQQQLAAARIDGACGDTLLLLEHPPTITLGRGADRSHILLSDAQLEMQGIDVVESDRGGDVTYHGPGQLVGYPVFHLGGPVWRRDLHRYLRGLEAVLIAALGSVGIAAGRFPGFTGVWVGLNTPAPAKIAAIGIKASRWVTTHGFALNVNTSLTAFGAIVPCGISGYGVTSVANELRRQVTVPELVQPVVAAFESVMGASIRFAPDAAPPAAGCEPG
ncbi:MAG: lipoyl(octanoyl) transferase LipB [Armatimonadetes bacterium]|nr:lipoyl(octanoyl) transferase LipB [Armatimonadota bacterium]MDE2207682.1 lipoyl(octanoyl) transferase LipB [Armatimonadota bacterium]